MKKIGLFLVGHRGHHVLDGLTHLGIKPEFVLTYKDPNIDANIFITTKWFCSDNDIKMIEGKRLPEELYDEVDLIMVIGWQFLLEDHLDKLVVIHDSKLPEYKGWAPTVNYLIEGSEYLAATAFHPTDVMDTGIVLGQETANIEYPLKVEKALLLVADLYIVLIDRIVRGDFEYSEMEGEESFCLWRDFDDYSIDWTQDCHSIVRFIDAVGHPYRGAKTRTSGHDGRSYIVRGAEAIDIKVVGNHQGKILRFDDDCPVVICGEGAIKITDFITDDIYASVPKFNKLKHRFV